MYIFEWLIWCGAVVWLMEENEVSSFAYLLWMNTTRYSLHTFIIVIIMNYSMMSIKNETKRNEKKYGVMLWLEKGLNSFVFEAHSIWRENTSSYRRLLFLYMNWLFFYLDIRLKFYFQDSRWKKCHIQNKMPHDSKYVFDWIEDNTIEEETKKNNQN